MKSDPGEASWKTSLISDCQTLKTQAAEEGVLIHKVGSSILVFPELIIGRIITSSGLMNYDRFIGMKQGS